MDIANSLETGVLLKSTYMLTNMHDNVPIFLQLFVSLIPVQMEEHAVHRMPPTIHVLVLLVLLVQTVG